MANKTTIKSDRAIPGLLFNNRGRWLEAPNWIDFFVDLGCALASSKEFTDENLFVAIAAPTRAFAANLIALGAVSRLSQTVSAKPSPDDHFNRISALKKGTVLQRIEKQKRYKCAFLGIETFQGTQCVKVAVNMGKNKVARLIPKNRCLDIILNGNEAIYEDKVTRKRNILERPEFTRHFVHPVCHTDFALEKRLDCKIIGKQNILKVEAKAEVLAVRSEDQFHKGTLNDILRIRELLSQDDPYRTQFLSSRNGDTYSATDNSPFLTIYDGANAYLKSDSANNCPVTAVVLDKTEPNFEIAAQNISDTFIKRRTGQIKLVLNYQAPQSVDILGFTEASK